MTPPPAPQSKAEFNRLLFNLPDADEASLAAARARQKSLTKPAGSLGRLEEIACWVAGWQQTTKPTIENPLCLVFAGNHGVAERRVSAYPQEVTAQMVANFEAGGAAVNQLCAAANVPLKVVALDGLRPTADITHGAAMTEEECLAAIAEGFKAVDHCDMLLVGEMGIGNSTSAAALAIATFGSSATSWVGVGTGVNESGVARKVNAIYEALSFHEPRLDCGFERMRRLGGKELAALMGAVLAARLRRVPVILDGFIATAAAAVLHADNKTALDHCLVSHLSSEQGHKKLLKVLRKKPVLRLDMRLGEASGAVTAFPIVKAAVYAHSGMATFAEASVSKKREGAF